MLIGNDIIDLQVDRSDDQRFAERTLTTEELSAIGGSSVQIPAVCYFGVKEAFYKRVRQVDSGYALKPRQISTDFTERRVFCSNHRLSFAYFLNKEFFYSWTIPEAGGHSINVVSILPINIANDPESESKGVRSLARNMLSCIYGLPEEEFGFSKGRGGEPIPMHEDDILSCSLSFTHHGRYCGVGYASEGHLSKSRIKQLKEMLYDHSVFVDLQNF